MGCRSQAADVAACIIETALSMGSPVSNLRLQKLLFLCQGEHLHEHRRPLFGDPIVAWQYGPVVESVTHLRAPGSL